MYSDQIEAGFKNYLCSTDKFAVLLTGDWGVGKSHFWDKKLFPLAEKKQLRVVKVSLFGIKTIGELKTKLVSAMMGDSVIVSGIKSVLKPVADILGGAMGTGAAEGLGQYSNSQILKAINNNTVVVFDDVERALISPIEVLGMANDLIDQQDCKFLFIADEEFLTSCNNSHTENPESFHLMKEKVIGHTWKLCWPPAEIVSILKSLAGPITKPLLDKLDLKIQELILTLDNYNLRTWIGAINRIEQFLDETSEQLHLEVLKENAFIFGLLCAQLIKQKHYPNEKIFAWVEYVAERSISADSLKMQKKDYKSDDYEIIKALSSASAILPSYASKALIKFMEYGFIDKDLVENETKSIIRDLEEPWHQQFIHYWNLENDQFSSLLKKACSALDKGEIKDSMAFAKLAQTFEQLVKNQLVGYDIHVLTQHWERYIDAVRNNGGFEVEFNGNHTEIVPYSFTESPSDFYANIKEKIKEVYLDSLATSEQIAGSEIWALCNEDNISLLCTKLRSRDYDRVPLFLVPINQSSIEAIKQLRNSAKHQLFLALSIYIDNTKSAKPSLIGQKDMAEKLRQEASASESINKFWLNELAKMIEL